MNWLAILGGVMLVVVIVSFFGAQPEGTRPVARTNLMTVARVLLIVTAIVVILVAVL